eukprot:GILI01006033.1.p1 GENE.GILI01006033.1~~GILI01006033.1.p1  ORF type:complete len:628 (+),score=120.85 GILI01006033.1:86-1969(+)
MFWKRKSQQVQLAEVPPENSEPIFTIGDDDEDLEDALDGDPYDSTSASGFSITPQKLDFNDDGTDGGFLPPASTAPSITSKTSLSPTVSPSQSTRHCGCTLPHFQSFSYMIIYISLGIAWGGVGPAIPFFNRTTGIELKYLSYLFTFRSLGSLLGGFFWGRMFDRFPGHLLMFGSACIVATNIFLIPVLHNFPLIFLNFFSTGFFSCCIDTGANFLIFSIWKEQTPFWMQCLHSCFGVGAFLAPFLTAWIETQLHSFSKAFFLLGAVTLCTGFFPLVLPSPKVNGSTEYVTVSEQEHFDVEEGQAEFSASPSASSPPPAFSPGSDFVSPSPRTKGKGPSLMSPSAPRSEERDSLFQSHSSAFEDHHLGLEHPVALPLGLSFSPGVSPRSLSRKKLAAGTNNPHALPSASTPLPPLELSPYQRIILILLICGMLAAYVGAESSLGGWLASYALKFPNVSEERADLIASCFWLGLTIGRVLGIPLISLLSPHTILLIDICGTLVSILWITFSSMAGSVIMVWIGAVAAGLFMSSAFPCAISLPTTIGYHASGADTGWFVVGSCFGDVAVTWVVGQLLDIKGVQALNMSLLLVWMLFMCFYAGFRVFEKNLRSRSVVGGASGVAHTDDKL